MFKSISETQTGKGRHSDDARVRMVAGGGAKSWGSNGIRKDGGMKRKRNWKVNTAEAVISDSGHLI